MDGVVVLDKPAGITSHSAVLKARRERRSAGKVLYTQRRIRLRLCRFAVRKGLPFRQLLFSGKAAPCRTRPQPRRSLGKIKDGSGRPQEL